MCVSHICLLPWLARRFLRWGSPLEPLVEANEELPAGGLPIASKLSRYGSAPPYLPTLAVEESTDPDEIRRFADRHSLPLVVKPVFGNHSRNVHRVERVDGILELAAEEPMVVQPYLNLPCEYGINVVRVGREVRVSGLTEIRRGEPGRTDPCHRDLTSETTPALREACQHAADQIDLDAGRFDVMATSREALLEGAFRIVEANGSCSLDLTVYDETHSLLRKIERLRAHWRQVLQEATFSHRNESRRNGSSTWGLVVDLACFLLTPQRFALRRGHEIEDRELTSSTESERGTPGG